MDLPIGTSEDRVTGTLDLERTLREGERHFEPGLLAAAHRGVLYIDEVNLLPDHLVDLLLDVAASGVNTVEREGISVRHPSRFLLVGTMNPEEGDLRPQFIDRFGLSVTVTAPRDEAERMEVVRRRMAFDADSERFVAHWSEEEVLLTERVRDARARLARIDMPEALLALTVRICLEANVDGLRPDLTIYRAACALAAFDGRTRVVEDDVYRAALLVLPHRRHPHPLDPPPGGAPPPTIEKIIAQHRAESVAGEESTRSPDQSGPSGEDSTDSDCGTAAPDRLVEAHAQMALHLPNPPQGRRHSSETARYGTQNPGESRGRVIGTRAWDRRSSDIAPLASALAAAGRPPEFASTRPRLAIVPRDLRQRRRCITTRRFVLFVVDCSGSMGARERMAVTKAAVLALLGDAYRARDLVALMGFRDTGASLLIKPTRDVVRAVARLQSLPTGGRTPLGTALLEASAVARRQRARMQAAQTRVVLITDGRTSQPDLTRGIVELTSTCDDIVVVDSEHGFVRLGRASSLATSLRARHVQLVA